MESRTPGTLELGGLTLGQRVAELRRGRGVSQKDFAVEVARSESWVSQVERDVLPVRPNLSLTTQASRRSISPSAINDVRKRSAVLPHAASQERGVIRHASIDRDPCTFQIMLGI